MRLENLLNTDNLNKLIADGYIQKRAHPTLPIYILNYSNKCMFENKWPYEACVCRGLVVDTMGNVISRPIPKFFNLGQTGPYIFRNDQGNMDVRDEAFDARFLLETAGFYHRPLTITRKLDGWAGISWNYEDKWGVASRGSFDSPGALYATEKFQKFVKYTAVEFIPKNTTLFFEIISKETRVVVPYNFEGLVLITAIDNETGKEMTYDALEILYKEINQYARERPWCRLVEKFDKSIEQCVADDSMTEEGYVIAILRTNMPPVRAKVKLAEYCRLHRILCGVTPQKIWAELADPMSPWLSHESKKDWNTGEIKHDMLVPRDFANWVIQWQNKMVKAFHERLLASLHVNEQFDFMNDDEFKDEHLKWRHLTKGFSADEVKVASLLHRGKVVEGLLHSVEPRASVRQGGCVLHGREGRVMCAL